MPVSIEQGAMALGATRWQAVSRRSSPRPAGDAHGTILAMSRAIGEAAPLIVVGGVVFATQVPSINPSRPTTRPSWRCRSRSSSGRDSRRNPSRLAAAGIIVLLATLIVMNLVAIFLRNRFSRRW